MKNLFVILCMFSWFMFYGQQTKIDSLKKAVVTQKDTSEVKTTYLIAKEFASTNLDSAKKYDALSLKKAIKIGYYKGEARALMLKAGIFRVKGEVDSATIIYNSIIKLADKHNLISESGEAYMFIGFILQNQSEFDKSVINLITAEKKFEKVNNTSLLARNSWMLGNTYLKLKSYPESENSFEKAKRNFGILNDSLGYFDCVLNISIIYNEKGLYSEAYNLITQSEKHYRKVKHFPALSAALINKGDVLSKLNKYKEAEDALLEALEIKKSVGAPLGIATCLLNLAELYETKKDHKAAETTYFEAIDIARKDNSQNIILMSYKGLYAAFKNQNKFNLALEYHEKYMSLNDSIYNSEKTKIIEEMRTKFDSEKKENENKLLQSENQLSTSTIRQQKITGYFIITGLLLALLLAYFVYRGLKQQRQANVIISKQKIIVEEKHREITDSINYAERIQKSFLATKELLNENLKNYFVLFQPKDVVSGDFYWAAASALREPQGSATNEKLFYLCTADSTGHGVPGAIMSILNISSLEKALEAGLTEPAEIFNHTRNTIIERLKKDGSKEGGKDGMDASIICFDFVKLKMKYAAANNPIWIIRKNEMIELAPDKMPVGKHDKDTTPFSQKELQLESGDLVYTLTDGMPDQFGGPKGKKFMYKQLKQLLILNANLEMEAQKKLLLEALNNWKDNLEQVDDITLIGIRIS